MTELGTYLAPVTPSWWPPAVTFRGSRLRTHGREISARDLAVLMGVEYRWVRRTAYRITGPGSPRHPAHYRRGHLTLTPECAARVVCARRGPIDTGLVEFLGSLEHSR